MNLLILMLLLGRPAGEWPRTAVTHVHADFPGWRSDTAWVRETIIHDLSAQVEETLLLVTTWFSAGILSPSGFDRTRNDRGGNVIHS